MSIGSGTRLGPYEVQDFIGQGAMGVVYRAYHSGLERTGAVKVVQALTPDPETVARFRHEAQAIARLNHPNIVDVYDFGEFQGTPYMIVQYVAGGSLAARLARGPLDRATALRYLRGMAEGLDYAHSHGIVHRDVKPANVLLTEDDSPVLADFGLAKLMQGSSLRSMTGVTTGTPAYMAPEQVTGSQVGPAADRYSLATIAYELLTGVIPFDGEALMELLYAQVHRYPSAPSARDATLGLQVDAVIMRGLAKNPVERWESCEAFVDALEAAMEQAPVPASVAPTMVLAPPVARTKPIAPPRQAAATVAMAFAATAPAPTVAPLRTRQSRPHSRRRILLGIAALLIPLLVLGVCAAVAQATTLSINPTRVAPGGTVTVTASHVPANKAGEIQLWSVVTIYPFQADGDGQVTLDIVVPLETEFGNHLVKLCWDNSCHKQAPLVVVSGTAQVQPTPTDAPSPSPNSSTTTPHPGSTPTPTPPPGHGPTPRPSSNPTSNPAPSPIPTANPCPGNASALVLSPSSQTVLLGGGTASFTGSNFTPMSKVTLSYYSPSTSSTPAQTWSVTASCAGGFSTSVVTKSNTGLLLRTDKVVACDIDKGCVTAKISVPVL